MRRFLRKLRQATTSLGRHNLWMSARNRAARDLADNIRDLLIVHFSGTDTGSPPS